MLPPTGSVRVKCNLYLVALLTLPNYLTKKHNLIPMKPNYDRRYDTPQI